MKRREAKALGLTKYNTGKPCKYGHRADRWTKNAVCHDCWQRYPKPGKLPLHLHTRREDIPKPGRPRIVLKPWHTMPTSRKDALAKGEKHYFTGKECCHGHIAPRRTSAANCTECQREWGTNSRGKKPNRWIQENKERWNKYQREYRKRRRDFDEEFHNRTNRHSLKNKLKARQYRKSLEDEQEQG